MWDAEGELASDDDYQYVYDASGTRIVRDGADGTTVYLPGGQELTISGSAVSATRYYAFGGRTVATRTSNGLGGVTSLVSDRDGSVVAAVPNTTWTTGSLKRVYSDPFGAVRGNTDAGVPGDHRFLGAPRDAASGLTLLGARYYDPGLGCFISVDPVLNLSVRAHLHAYAYGFNNPVSFSDASGLEPRDRNGNYDGNPYGRAPGGGPTVEGSSVGQSEWWNPGWAPWNSWSQDDWQNAGAIAAGIGVGIAITGLVLAVGACTVVTFGVCGVGAGVVVAALVAGGVAGSLVTYQYSTGQKTPEGYVQSGLVGGVAGLAGPALGPVARTLLGKAATGAANAAASQASASGAVQAADDVAQAASSTYVNITKPGSRYPNFGTNVGPDEFGETLVSNGWTQADRSYGLLLFSSGSRTWAVRPIANTYDGWSADLVDTSTRSILIKIRLGYPADGK